MSKNISPALDTAAQSSEIQTRMLLTIYLDPVPIRLVANDNQDLTYKDELYVAAEISRGDISTSVDGQKEQVAITLSNKWQEWAAYLANNGNTLNGKRCVIQEVFLDHLEEDAIWLFEGVLNKVKMTISEFSVVVERDTISFDADAPLMTYDPMCQFTYKDQFCQCISGYDTCDKTLNSCIARNNVTRFGGHPSIPREMVIKG